MKKIVKEIDEPPAVRKWLKCLFEYRVQISEMKYKQFKYGKA